MQVASTARQIHRGHSSADRHLSPVVDHELVVDPEAVAVVPFDTNLTCAGGRNGDRARPPRRIPVERNTARRRVERPAEVDALVDANDARLPFEAIVVEVFAAQSAHRIAAGARMKIL